MASPAYSAAAACSGATTSGGCGRTACQREPSPQILMGERCVYFVNACELSGLRVEFRGNLGDFSNNCL